MGPHTEPITYRSWRKLVGRLVAYPAIAFFVASRFSPPHGPLNRAGWTIFIVLTLVGVAYSFLWYQRTVLLADASGITLKTMYSKARAIPWARRRRS